MRVWVPGWCFCALLICGVAAAQSVQDQLGLSHTNNQQWVSLQPVADFALTKGKTGAVTLHFEVGAGNHVNSNKPSSALLIPTRLKLEPTAGLSVVKVSYPAGQDLTFPFDPDEKLNVYTGAFPVTVQLRAGAKPGSFPIHGDLIYQACNDRACFPPKKLPVEFEIKVVSGKP
jgi:hypothetical protein